ncbi:MAG: AraC family transcriptional regulator [bacterium]
MDKTIINQRFDYLTPKDRQWGIHLCGVGMRLTPPHVPYQVYEDGAPYQWKHGRVLRDYSLVYITQGAGVFRVRGARPLQVSAGDVLLIRPEVWHDYAPTPETGWKEYWMMFNGRQAEKLISQVELPLRAPLLHFGVDESLHHLFTQMLEVAEAMPPFAGVIHTGLVLQMAALIQSRFQLQKEQGGREESFVRQAKQQLAGALEQPVDMQTLAHSLGVSYPHFRRVFKTSTGLPPQQYLLNLRINRAKQLMEEPGVKLSEVARRAGFDDSYYFSRVFKQKTGIPPSQWRH